MKAPDSPTDCGFGWKGGLFFAYEVVPLGIRTVGLGIFCALGVHGQCLEDIKLVRQVVWLL